VSEEAGQLVGVDEDSEAELDLIRIELAVPRECDGWRLDRFVQFRIPRLSRTRIQKMIRAQAELGGAALRPASRVVGGQRIELLRPAPDEPDVPRHYRVIARDGPLIVIDKPAGLPVHATARYHRNTLMALLRDDYDPPYPRLVHRLDRETSGVLLLCRDPVLEAALKGELAHRRAQKRYLAIVRGELPHEEGQIEGAIGPHPESGIRVKMCVRAEGQPARTRYRVLERRGAYALVEAEPQTGRQHQIRVHLAHAGAYVVGDKLYGPDPSCMLEHLETGWTEALAERLELPRHALHAAAMTIRHPPRDQELHFEAPLSADLQAFWDSLAPIGG
jgi:23S rRNA pseudouridine1911/1915/1917 synthase